MKKITCKCSCHIKPKDHKGIGCCDLVNVPRVSKDLQRIRLKGRYMNYKQMVRDINELVDNDFCFDMDCHNLPHSKPITQEEAMQMVGIIGNVYRISHCIHCTACGGKYRKLKA